MGYVRDYLLGVTELLAAVDEAEVELLVARLDSAWRDGRRVLLMGNGGSAATASHIVNDLQKCLQLECGRPLRALCLSDNTPLVLAWGNDTEFARIFAPQVECWAEPDDLVIGISGSGNSPNVLRAIESANARGCRTFGLCGFDGGRLARTATESIIVRCQNMQQVEDLHMVLLHVVFSAVRDRAGT